MTRKLLTALVIALTAAALWAAGCRPEPTPVARGPNLVLVSVDTLRPDELRAFAPDAQHLPNVDRFAEGAARFTQAFSTSSWTLPAHASLLTGFYPHHHAAVHPEVRLAPAMPTLAETLGSAGYRTVAFTHGVLLQSRYGFGRGFDLYDHERSPSARLSERLVLPRDGRVPGRPGEDLFDRAIAFIESRRSSAPPFFLFTHTYNVHDYFKVNPWVRVPEDPDGPSKMSRYLECLRGHQSCSDAEWDLLRRYYRAEIRHFDEGFGRLLEALERHVREPTYVMLVSDHGEGFDPHHDRTHHGGRLHDDLIRVPLLLAGPGVPAGAVGAPVSLVDVAPTLLELAGVAASPDLDGRSLLAPPTAHEENRVFHASQYATICRNGALLPLAVPAERPLSAAVISGEHRLIVTRSGTELYAVAGDPWQRENLAATHPDLVRSLLRHLQPILKRRLELWSLEPSSALRKELRALGYL